MLEETLNKDYIQAMKDKNTLKSSTLSFLRASVKNVRIDKKVDQVSDEDVIGVIKKQIKQRQDSIDQFEKGGRKDLVEKEQAELNILKEYLPAEISETELVNIVKSAIKESSAVSAKDMGKVMKIVLSKTSGRADSKLVSDVVKRELSTL